MELYRVVTNFFVPLFAELNVEEKLVLMSASGNKAKALCHSGAITCSSFDVETQTPITGSYDMTVKIWNYDNLTAHAQVFRDRMHFTDVCQDPRYNRSRFFQTFRNPRL